MSTAKIYTGQSKSSVLLTELVIVILFFALTAAAAMTLFVNSYIESRTNTQLQDATVVCQNWVEQMRGVEDIPAFLTDNGFTDMGEGAYKLDHDHDTVIVARPGEEKLSDGTLHFCKVNVGHPDQVLGTGSPESQNKKRNGNCELSVATYVPSGEVAN